MLAVELLQILVLFPQFSEVPSSYLFHKMDCEAPSKFYIIHFMKQVTARYICYLLHNPLVVYNLFHLF